MKKKIISLTIIVAIAFSSCKKQISQQQNDSIAVEQSEAVQKVKDWFVKETKKIASINEPQFNESELQWNQTVFYDHDNISATPVYTNYKKAAGNFKQYKFLVVKQNESVIENGRYVRILEDKESNNYFMSSAEIEGTLTGKAIPRVFSGAIITYDLNNAIIKNEHYQKGILDVTKKDEITSKKEQQSTSPETTGLMKQPCSGELCTDWYWQTWYEGELISEEYIGSTCKPCGGGGGGNSGNTPSDYELASAEYNTLHDAEFSLTTTVTVGIPTTATTSITKLIEWPLATSSYFEVKCKSSTSAYFNNRWGIIHVENLVNNTTTFRMLSSSIFWKISWDPGNLFPGVISNNDGNYIRGESNVTGNVRYEAKSSLWEIFNSRPDMAVDSHLITYYNLTVGADINQ